MRGRPTWFIPVVLGIVTLLIVPISGARPGSASVGGSIGVDGERGVEAPGLAGFSGTETGVNPSIAPAPLQAVTSCSTPYTDSVRGTSVTFDKCYDQTFTHDGTEYGIRVFYTEDSGKSPHHMTGDGDGDDTDDHQEIVNLADEVEDALIFYFDRDLQVLPSGDVDFIVLVGEDPRLGGINTPETIHLDDEAIEGGDPLWHRLLAYHETMHLIQDKYDNGGVGWKSFYGEGIARAIQDRVEGNLDSVTSNYLFWNSIDAIMADSGGDRSSNITTISYDSTAFWTWLFDQYRAGGDTEPDIGWDAMLDFYQELNSESDQVKAIKDFISSEGGSFTDDFIDYTLALYAYLYTSTDDRVDFIDAEVNANGNSLSGHTTITGGPAFSTDTPNMSKRSSRYWEFNPASQCDYVAFEFDGNGKDYGFSVVTVDGGALQQRWTSFSDEWARTVRSADLDRVVGVVTAVDNSGTVDVGYGCVTPSIEIEQPTSSAEAEVGTADNPRTFITRVEVTGKSGSGVAGLIKDAFDVTIEEAGGGTPISADIVNSVYVLDDYWLLVQAPSDTDGAESGKFYDLTVSLNGVSDTNNSSVLYVERTEDVIVVLDRSGSMGGGTGKIDAAKNAGFLIFNEVSDDDQAGYVTFAGDASLEEALDQVGINNQRSDLITDVQNTVDGGWTSIGDGMKKAADDHDANGDADNVCSFVLLSDGHENEPELWADVEAQVTDNGCTFHVVGFGPEADETLLQDIANSIAGGTYDYAPNSGGVPIGNPTTLDWTNNLARIFDYFETEISGRQRIHSAVENPIHTAKPVSAAPGSSTTVDFESLSVGNQYKVGDTFSDSGVAMTGEAFFWSSGTSTDTGVATVGNDQSAGGSGLDLGVNNINVDFDFGGPADSLSLLFADLGGNENLEINGDQRNVSSLSALNGATVGSVEVTVEMLDNTHGQLTLGGANSPEIRTFSIGGQEFWIDNVSAGFDEDGLPSFFVDDATDELVASFSWQNDAPKHNTRLFDPDGNAVDSKFKRVSPQGTNDVWEVPKPQEGFWEYEVTGVEQEVYVSAQALSRYQLHMVIGKSPEDRWQGAEIPIFASFVGPTGPITGATVTARVTAPDGTQRLMTLHDDGDHLDGDADDGIYGNTYTATSQGEVTNDKPDEGKEPAISGSYLVNVVAKKGKIQREAQASFSVPQGADSDDDGVPDRWEEAHGLNPSDPEDVFEDPDGDGLDSKCEFELGTDPHNSDTDGGGESDGSEVPDRETQSERCRPGDKDPLNPDDDAIGPLSNVEISPEANSDFVPRFELAIGTPLKGILNTVDIFRATFDEKGNRLTPWSKVASGHDGRAFTDDTVQTESRYRYRVVPQVTPPEGKDTLTGRIFETHTLEAKGDPYPPGGAVIIEGGAPSTPSTTVDLEITADDSGTHEFDGGPDPSNVPTNSPDQLDMRLSNSLDFSASTWQPFKPMVEDWDLGDLEPGEVGTVFVQFRDPAGNIGDGFGDSIRLESDEDLTGTGVPFMEIHRDSEDYSGASTWDGDDEDGATGVVVGIDEILDGAGSPLATEIGAYSAELHYDGACINVLELRNGRDFTIQGQSVDNNAGTASFNGINVQGDEARAIMAFAVLRLVGDVNDTCTLELRFTDLTDVDGNAIGIDDAPLIAEFRRGNARQDDRVNIADALFGAQYLAELRDGCVEITSPGETAAGNADTACMNPVNLAGVRTDGDTDRVSIADVLFIAQYLADLRDEGFQLVEN